MIQMNNRTSKGFTLVELMLAMAFIAILLLAVVGVVIQVGSIYSKGTTMKSVNQASRAVVADMRRTIAESAPFVLSTSLKADAGRFCTGTYTYVWNIGSETDPSDPATQMNRYAGSDSAKQLRLVKVRDSGKRYCAGTAATPIEFADATELLSYGTVSVQRFSAEQLTTNVSSGKALYAITLLLSDADQEAIDTIDGQCKPPSEETVYQNYCAVNEIEFTAQAGNMGGRS